MYGKFFASTFTGSMVGAGTDVFAVWGYVIANATSGQVELNPKLLAPMLGTSVEAVTQAIEFLCRPDDESRSQDHNGCRLIREGTFAYIVPNHLKYRSIRNEDDRREYNRIKKQESRERMSKTKSLTGQPMSAVSAHTEAEAEAEAEAKTKAKEEKKKKTTSPSAPSDVSPEVWTDFLKTRKAALTETALAGIRREAKKAGMTLEEALRMCCERAWRGFKAEWMKDMKPSSEQVVDEAYEILQARQRR